MSKFAIYMSHSIRGMKGSDATAEEMAANNLKAIAFGKEVRGCFPEDIELYVPGDGDEFISIAYKEGILTDTQILHIDCELIDKRDMVLAWSPDQFMSGGMMVELIHASKAGKDVAVVQNIEEATQVINAALERRLS